MFGLVSVPNALPVRLSDNPHLEPASPGVVSAGLLRIRPPRFDMHSSVLTDACNTKGCARLRGFGVFKS